MPTFYQDCHTYSVTDNFQHSCFGQFLIWFRSGSDLGQVLVSGFVVVISLKIPQDIGTGGQRLKTITVS